MEGAWTTLWSLNPVRHNGQLCGQKEGGRHDVWFSAEPWGREGEHPPKLIMSLYTQPCTVDSTAEHVSLGTPFNADRSTNSMPTHVLASKTWYRACSLTNDHSEHKAEHITCILCVLTCAYKYDSEAQTLIGLT